MFVICVAKLCCPALLSNDSPCPCERCKSSSSSSSSISPLSARSSTSFSSSLSPLLAVASGGWVYVAMFMSLSAPKLLVKTSVSSPPPPSSSCVRSLAGRSFVDEGLVKRVRRALIMVLYLLIQFQFNPQSSSSIQIQFKTYLEGNRLARAYW